MTENKPAVDEIKLIDAAVEYINKKVGDNYYKTALEVGDYVLKHFFDDSIAKVRSKSSNKEHSFKSLCENSKLQVHPKHLYQMVLVAAQEKIFKINKKEELLNKLNYSLKVELLRVNTNQQKFTFAKHFIDNKFTVLQAKEYLNKKLGTVTGSDIIPFNKPLVDQFKKISDWSQIKEINVDISKIKSVNRADEMIKNIDDFITLFDKLVNIKKKLEDTKKTVVDRKKKLQEEAKKKDDAK